MITPIGKVLRKLRIDDDERLLEMAERLGKSPSFISAIERGTKAPPAGFEEAVIEAYSLAPDAATELCRAADITREAHVLRPETELGRDTAGLLARKMQSISDNQWSEIKGILKKGK